MKQLNLVTVGGVFSLPLKTKSLKTAKAQAESIATRGVWVKTVFLTPNVTRFIEVADVEPPTKNEASIPVPKEEAPVPTLASPEQS